MVNTARRKSTELQENNLHTMIGYKTTGNTTNQTGCKQINTCLKALPDCYSSHWFVGISCERADPVQYYENLWKCGIDFWHVAWNSDWTPDWRGGDACVIFCQDTAAQGDTLYDCCEYGYPRTCGYGKCNSLDFRDACAIYLFTGFIRICCVWSNNLEELSGRYLAACSRSG